MNILDTYGFRYVIRGSEELMKEIQIHRCCRRHKFHCKATIKTKGDLIISQGNEHNHPPDSDQ